MPPPSPGAPPPPPSASEGKGKKGCLWWGLGAFALLVIIGIVAAIAGGGNDTDQATSTTAPDQGSTTAKPTTTTTAKPTTTTTAPTTTTLPPPQEYSGSGDDIVDLQTPMEPGMVLNVAYQGGSNFVVQADTDLLVNTIGGYLGTVMYTGSSPSTYLEIKASGPWQIVVRHPAEARPWDPASGPLTGSGDDVVRVTPALSTDTTMQINYTGKSNFVVRTYTNQGRANLAVNEIDTYTGAVRFPRSTLIIEVNASGDWTIAPR